MQALMGWIMGVDLYEVVIHEEISCDSTNNTLVIFKYQTHDLWVPLFVYNKSERVWQGQAHKR